MKGSQLIITNNYRFVMNSIDKFKSQLNCLEMNFTDITQKMDIKELLALLSTLPCLDKFRLFQIDISKFSSKEQREIAKAIKSNEQAIIFCVYYVKDKLDKGKEVEDIFKKTGIEINKSISINEREVKELLSIYDLKNVINPQDFMTSDNIDMINNDCRKISCLQDKSQYKRYITKSFNSNVFDLIDAVMKLNVDKTVEILDSLLEQENPVTINLLILKHFYLLKQIQDLLKIDKNIDLREEIYRRTKLASKDQKQGNYIHPYRLMLLKNQAAATKINIDFAVAELLKNEINKGNTDTFAMQMSLVKIIKEGRK